MWKCYQLLLINQFLCQADGNCFVIDTLLLNCSCIYIIMEYELCVLCGVLVWCDILLFTLDIGSYFSIIIQVESEDVDVEEVSWLLHVKSFWMLKNGPNSFLVTVYVSSVKFWPLCKIAQEIISIDLSN